MLSRSCCETTRALSALAIAAALSALPAAVHAGDPISSDPPPAVHAAHAHGAAPAPADRGGKRWAADPALQDGMRRVRQAVQALEHDAQGQLDSAQTTRIADLIDGAVRDIIAHCKLDPDADAALHGLLAKFLAGAHAARSGQNVPAALADMQGALKQYPVLFDDPTWNAASD